MKSRKSEADQSGSRAWIDLQDRYPSSITEGRARNPMVEGREPRKYELNRSFSKKLFPTRASYFSVESLLVLVGLTASLLILPLILPPLPPPPSMLLLLPIAILGLLMILAFMPPNVRDVTYKHM